MFFFFQKKKPKKGAEQFTNKRVGVNANSFFLNPYRERVGADQIVSASNYIFWSPEGYVVTCTPAIAGGQYVVRERNTNRHSIHEFEDDIRPSELMGAGP